MNSLIFPANVAAQSYPWPINFLRSRCFSTKKDCKDLAIVPASVIRQLTISIETHLHPLEWQCHSLVKEIPTIDQEVDRMV